MSESRSLKDTKIFLNREYKDDRTKIIQDMADCFLDFLDLNSTISKISFVLKDGKDVEQFLQSPEDVVLVLKKQHENLSVVLCVGDS